MDSTNALEELARIEKMIRLCERRLKEQGARLASMKPEAAYRHDSEHLHANLVASMKALKALREVVKKEVRDARL